VTVEPGFWTCGKCDYCRSGFNNLCNQRQVLGYWHNGAFAKYCTVPEHGLHKLPDNVDYLSGALTEPLACCVHGVIEQTKLSAGDFVVVAGPGAIGLLSLQLAKAEGGIVAVCGTSADEKRLEMAAALGATLTINVEKENAVEIIGAHTGGYGADVVLECSGAAPAARLGLELARKRGKYTQMGLFGNSIQIDFEKIAFKELQVTGFIAQKRTAWERALKLLSHGMVSTKALVTHEMSIDEWKRAFDIFERREGLKLILHPE
jgi:L-iditol 2-dehydrogenase